MGLAEGVVGLRGGRAGRGDKVVLCGACWRRTRRWGEVVGCLAVGGRWSGRRGYVFVGVASWWRAGRRSEVIVDLAVRRWWTARRSDVVAAELGSVSLWSC